MLRSGLSLGSLQNNTILFLPLPISGSAVWSVYGHKSGEMLHLSKLSMYTSLRRHSYGETFYLYSGKYPSTYTQGNEFPVSIRLSVSDENRSKIKNNILPGVTMVEDVSFCVADLVISHSCEEIRPKKPL